MRQRRSSRSGELARTSTPRSSRRAASGPGRPGPRMTVVCDMGPLHYLVLIGAEHVLPQLYTRILTPPAVIAELSRPTTPEAVRLWVKSPPPWLEVQEPSAIEDIPSLGKKGTRGAGEKAAIALAREAGVDAIL